MVLNQVHPSRCATSNPSQQGHLPGAWGCRHRRRQGFAANASLPDWLEGGGGPLANTSSQEHGQLKSAMQSMGSSRAPWQLVARVGQRIAKKTGFNFDVA